MARTLTRRRTTRSSDAYSPADDPEDIDTLEDDEEEEDDRPRFRTRRSSRRGSPRTDEGRTARRSRRSSDDDDDDDDELPTTAIGRGWGSYEKTRSATSNFPEQFKASEEAVIIKFLEDEPFLVFLQHWVERRGKKSWTCLQKRCPLCDDAGDRPSQQACFNIVDFTDPEDPQLKVWQVGPMVADILKNYAKDKKTGPINKDGLYFSVSKSTKKNKTNYYITPVKERDLPDDWDIEPLTDEELEEFSEKIYDEDILKVNTRAELKQIVREILDD